MATMLDTKQRYEAFLSDLTDLSVKYEIGITEDGVLYEMENEDMPYSYKYSEDGKLIRE